MKNYEISNEIQITGYYVNIKYKVNVPKMFSNILNVLNEIYGLFQ